MVAANGHGTIWSAASLRRFGCLGESALTMAGVSITGCAPPGSQSADFVGALQMASCDAVGYLACGGKALRDAALAGQETLNVFRMLV